LNVFLACQSFVTIKYYMKLLSDEYQRDLSQQNVNKAIRLLFEDPRLIQVI